MTVEIALRAARVRYGQVEALHGVDLAIPAGCLTVLAGRNGSGRTSALHALAGAVPLASGQVVWRGTDVTGMTAHQRARRGMACVPDQRAVFSSLTVAENLALFGTGEEPALSTFPALRALLDHRAGTLSGGEQRMLALCRMLREGADPVLVDEPAQGLSAATATAAYAALVTIAASGRTVVTAEQQLPDTLRPATRVVYELRRGSVAFSGEPSTKRPGRAT